MSAHTETRDAIVRLLADTPSGYLTIHEVADALGENLGAVAFHVVTVLVRREGRLLMAIDMGKTYPADDPERAGLPLRYFVHPARADQLPRTAVLEIPTPEDLEEDLETLDLELDPDSETWDDDDDDDDDGTYYRLAD